MLPEPVDHAAAASRPSTAAAGSRAATRSPAPQHLRSLPPEMEGASAAPSPVAARAQGSSFSRPSSALSSQQLQEVVHRLYDETLAARRERQAEAIRERDKVEASQRMKPAVALDKDAVDESVARLYASGVKHKLEEHRKLAERYLFKPVPKKVEESRADLEKRVVERFYVEERQRQSERQKKLFEQYIAPTGPKKHIRSRDEIADILARLTTKA